MPECGRRPTAVISLSKAAKYRTTSFAGAPQVPPTRDEAAALQAMMRGVVTSGTTTFQQYVPGEPVSAKSETTQCGTPDPPSTNAWMIAFQGDLAVAMFVEIGEYVTATAGPLPE